MGRVATRAIDGQGRTLQSQIGTLIPNSFTYDTHGRLAQIAQGPRVTSLAYDASGNLASMTDPLNQTTSYLHDSVGHVTSLGLPDGRQVGFTYDADGNMTSLTPPGRPTYNFLYSLLDIATSFAAPLVGLNPTVTQYTYNADRQLASVTRPDGVKLSYNYDTPTPRLLGISSSLGGYAFAYDSHGMITSSSSPDGVTSVYAYVGSLLTSQETTAPVTTTANFSYNNNFNISSTNIGGVAFNYFYDKDRLLTTISTSAGNYNLTRDAQGLVTATSFRNLQEQYTYDSNGNRIAATVNAQSVTATYDAQDRLLTYGNNTYQYTANGELFKKTEPAGSTSYAYNIGGKLTNVVFPDGTSQQRYYDGFNKIVARTDGVSIVRAFTHDEEGRVASELNAANVLERFAYGTKSNSPDIMLRNGVPFKIITDQLGSVRLVVNAVTLQVIQQIDYDEFGNVMNDTNPGFQSFGFAGGQYNSKTLLLGFGARHYDPETGRWLAKDPIGFDGRDTNLYGYVLNDPINFIDPKGLLRIPPILDPPPGINPNPELNPPPDRNNLNITPVPHPPGNGGGGKVPSNNCTGTRGSNGCRPRPWSEKQ